MSETLFLAVLGGEGETFGANERPSGPTPDRSHERAPRLVRAQPQPSPRRAFDLPDDIVRRLRAHDPEALETLMHIALSPLVQFASGFVHSRDAAEDIVQEVFVRVWERAETLALDVSLTAYLYTAVRNRALNSLRATASESRMKEHVREHTTAAEWADAAPPGTSPEQMIRWNELMVAFEAGLAALTERQRSALLLRFEQGRTVPEIAQVLEISVKAAEKLVSRGLHELRARMAAVAR